MSVCQYVCLSICLCQYVYLSVCLSLPLFPSRCCVAPWLQGADLSACLHSAYTHVFPMSAEQRESMFNTIWWRTPRWQLGGTLLNARLTLSTDGQLAVWFKVAQSDENIRFSKPKQLSIFWFYISNSATGALIKHLSPHRRERWYNWIEPATTEAHGIRVLACLPKLIWHAYISKNSQTYLNRPTVGPTLNCPFRDAVSLET